MQKSDAMKKVTYLLIIVISCLLVGFDDKKQSIITITFDDGNLSTYQVAYPILKQLDVQASVAIISNTFVQGSSKTLNIKQLKELQQNKWEIISHSVTHPKFTKLKKEQLTQEIYTSFLDMKHNGFRVNGFVTPYSQCPDLCQPTLKRAYSYAFTEYRSPEINRNLNDLLITKRNNQYQLYRLNIDKLDNDTLISYIDYVAENGGWLSLYLHNVDTPGFISKGTFVQAIEYMKNKDVLITVPSHAVKLIYGK